MSQAKLLMGLGCPECGGSCGMGDIATQAKSDITNYDIITVGGKQYSANQIVDRVLTASKDVGLYSGYDFSKPFYTIKAGQSIGKVFSYIKPTDPAGVRAKSGLLMFFNINNQPYYVKDEEAINQTTLKDQGALTVSDENKIVKEAEEKENDPVGYYLKKYGLPVLLIGGGIYAAIQIGKAYITRPRASKTETSPA